MDVGTFGIAFALFINVILLLWFIIGSKGYWWVKVPVIAITMILSIGIWNSVNDLKGWPSDQALPQKFQVYWIIIEEPNPRQDDPGAIYVWAKDLDPQPGGWWIFHSMDESGEPRAHRLPYSEQLKKQSRQILKGLKAGGSFKGTMKKPGGKPGMKGKPGGPKAKGDGGSFSKEQIPMFYKLPPPKFPDKQPAQ